MIELTIPQLGEENRNVKDLVFTLLSVEQPLSIIELTKKIQKNYNIRITYQAVRKAVNTLEKQGVLGKESKKYRIDKQYYVNFKVTKGDVEDLIKKAEKFRRDLQDFIARLNSEKIENCRKKLESLL